MGLTGGRSPECDAGFWEERKEHEMKERQPSVSSVLDAKDVLRDWNQTGFGMAKVSRSNYSFSCLKVVQSWGSESRYESHELGRQDRASSSSPRNRWESQWERQ